MILKYDFKLAETRAKSGGYTFRNAWGSVKVNIAFVCFFVSLFELTVFFYNSNDRNNKSDVFVVRYFFA